MIRSVAIPLALVLLSAGGALAGTLEIETQPGVAVYWEGVHLATTDSEGVLVVEDVPPGPFALTLSKEGFEELATRVTIGEGTTRLSRPLRPIAAASAPAAAEAIEPEPRVEPPAEPPPVGRQAPTLSEDPAVEAATRPAAPSVRASRGAWLAGIVALGLAAALVARSRLKATPQAPPGPPGQGRARRAPRVTREPAEPKAGGGFLNELRQRERALDELVDVSSDDGRRAAVPEPDVVDVAWKEID